MQLTTRESQILICGRTGLASEQARRLLVAGAAGPGELVGRSTLYDADRVHDLAARPAVDLGRLAHTCPCGLYVARLDRASPLSVSASWADQARVAAAQPPLPPLTRASINVRIGAWGPLPWLATISGLVVFGAQAEGAHTEASGRTRFQLAPPGAWFDAVADRWFPTGRGRHWVMWLPPLTQ
jgi:hypothetical protein